jgi:hypothetical protein
MPLSDDGLPGAGSASTASSPPAVSDRAAGKAGRRAARVVKAGGVVARLHGVGEREDARPEAGLVVRLLVDGAGLQLQRRRSGDGHRLIERDHDRDRRPTRYGTPGEVEARDRTAGCAADAVEAPTLAPPAATVRNATSRAVKCRFAGGTLHVAHAPTGDRSRLSCPGGRSLDVGHIGRAWRSSEAWRRFTSHRRNASHRLPGGIRIPAPRLAVFLAAAGFAGVSGGLKVPFEVPRGAFWGARRGGRSSQACRGGATCAQTPSVNARDWLGA